MRILPPPQAPRLVPGRQVATTTAGSQPTATMGPQLPCRIASTVELTPTTATAIPLITYIHRTHGLMMDPAILSSILVMDKLT
jgi:hypothetical protein